MTLEDAKRSMRNGWTRPLGDEALSMLDAQSWEDGARCGGFTMRLLIAEVYRLREEARVLQLHLDGIGKEAEEQLSDTQHWLDESPGRSVAFSKGHHGAYEAVLAGPDNSPQGVRTSQAYGKNLPEAFLAAKVKL